MTEPFTPFRADESPFKVFGIGLNKTGTTSLRVALKALGYRHMDRRPRLMRHWRRKETDALIAATREHDSFDDWPWPLIVPDLLEAYGQNARFVLTRRASPQRWLNSIKHHSERTNPFRHPRRAIYGYDYPHGREAAYLNVYNRHLKDTRALFASAGKSHLLLEVSWDAGDGWRALCDFLGKKSPRRPFPHANDRHSAKPDPDNVDDNRFLIARQLLEVAEAEKAKVVGASP